MNSQQQDKTCGVYLQKYAHTPDCQGFERILIWLDQRNANPGETWDFRGFEGNKTQDKRNAKP